MRREKPEPFVPCLSNGKKARPGCFFFFFIRGCSNRVLIQCTLQCGAGAVVVEVSQVIEISILVGNVWEGKVGNAGCVQARRALTHAARCTLQMRARVSQWCSTSIQSV